MKQEKRIYHQLTWSFVEMSKARSPPTQEAVQETSARKTIPGQNEHHLANHKAKALRFVFVDESCLGGLALLKPTLLWELASVRARLEHDVYSSREDFTDKNIPRLRNIQY